MSQGIEGLVPKNITFAYISLQKGALDLTL